MTIYPAIEAKEENNRSTKWTRKLQNTRRKKKKEIGVSLRQMPRIVFHEFKRMDFDQTRHLKILITEKHPLKFVKVKMFVWLVISCNWFFWTMSPLYLSFVDNFLCNRAKDLFIFIQFFRPFAHVWIIHHIFVILW